jgi:hypothetical protein
MKTFNALAAVSVAAAALLLNQTALAQTKKEATTFKIGPVTFTVDNSDPNNPVTTARIDCGQRIDLTGKICLTTQEEKDKVTAAQKYQKEMEKVFSCDNPDKCELVISIMSTNPTETKCEGGKEWEVKLRLKCRKKTVE